ncbi:MAG: phosphoglycerate mutase family protein [Caldilineaceae bacterium]|nr:phosphoglycerate mutase family protein [Caldilineaceae bacterium]HRJ42618.1 histidine phosphatase family protein [Caldilineaceae bacterium]
MILYLIRHGQSANNLLGEQVTSADGTFNNAAYETYMSTRVADPALTPVGEEQAQQLAKFLCEARPKHRSSYDDPPEDELRGTEVINRLGISRIFCSPMLRTMQTAQPAAQALGINPELWVDVHEHGGIFDNQSADRSPVGRPGMTRSQIETRFPGYVIGNAVGEAGWWSGGEEDRPTCDGRAIRVAARLQEMAGELGDQRIAIVTHGTFMDSLVSTIVGRLPGHGFHFSHYNTGITRIDYTQSWRDKTPLLLIRYTNRVDHLLPELIT